VTTTALLSLLGAAAVLLVTVAAKVGAWLRGRRAERREAALMDELERTGAARDRAEGLAVVAERQAEVLADHADNQAAGHAVAEEVRDAASAAGPDPAARIAAVDDWVRAHADGGGAGPVPGGGAAPAVPRRR